MKLKPMKIFLDSHMVTIMEAAATFNGSPQCVALAVQSAFKLDTWLYALQAEVNSRFSAPPFSVLYLSTNCLCGCLKSKELLSLLLLDSSTLVYF